MEAVHRGGEGRGPTVLVSSVESDSHTWNLVYLQLVLEEHGCRVINLGACVPDDMLLREAVRHAPDLVVISSVNGHGATDGCSVMGRLRACVELDGVPVVIGGKLGTDGASHEGRLRDAGFDAVFEGDDAIERLVDLLAERWPGTAQVLAGAAW